MQLLKMWWNFLFK